MTIATSRCVADHYESTLQAPVADDPRLSIVSARVLNLKGGASKDHSRIIEIQAATLKCLGALGRIVGDAHVYCNYKNPGWQREVRTFGHRLQSTDRSPLL
ncbi:MAG TPA: hypothetical protein PLC64_08185 [Steroidobacteraceae bacterium]|nr:hypothetical protein [Steroidobacteraceae bacterium]